MGYNYIKNSRVLKFHEHLLGATCINYIQQ